MKVHLLLPLTIAVTVILVVVVKIRKSECDKVNKQNRMERIRMQVTHDLLGGYQEEKMSLENQIEQSNKNVETLKSGALVTQEKALKTKEGIQTCHEALKNLNEEVMAVQTQFNNLKGGKSKERDSWIAELESLKKQLQDPSPICAFLKKGGDSTSKLCNSEVKPEEPKAEPTNPEEPKAEESKAEAPKPEAPKL